VEPGVTGWAPDGTPVDLSPWQEEAVRALLGWDGAHAVHLPVRGRQGGKSVVISTVARYDRARSRGAMLRGDPQRTGAAAPGVQAG
jgi:hypothetical protein